MSGTFPAGDRFALVMYALLVESADGQHELLATADAREQAVSLGKQYSYLRHKPVIAVLNGADGNTAVTCRFLAGLMTECRCAQARRSAG